jgi:hypothetical protein
MHAKGGKSGTDGLTGVILGARLLLAQTLTAIAPVFLVFP